MTWLEEHKQYIDTGIHRFFVGHYNDNVTESEKTFQEAVMYAMQYGNPTRIHPILSMVVYEEVLGLLAADSVVDILIGLEFIHVGIALHSDATGISNHYTEEEMPVIKKYGQSMTILVGDALMEIGLDCLTRSGKMNIIQEAIHATGDTGVLRGFSRDILTDRDTISESEYITMYDEELSRLVNSSLIIGAFVAGDVQQPFIDELRRFGTFLTRMYQVRLDVADYEKGQTSNGSFSRKRGVVDFLGYEKATTLRATIEYELVKMTNGFQSPKFKDIVEFFANQKI